MKKASKHSAGGALAGYMFQPERAFFHLASAPRDTQVGIETLDDVALLLPGNRQVREQDKHYTSKTLPFADRSKDLWNSLNIWLNAIDEEDLTLDLVEFHLVTNKVISSGLVYELAMLPNNDTARVEFVRKLRLAGQNPPEKLKSIYASVLARSDEEIVKLVSRIRVFDGKAASAGSDLLEQIENTLHLPPQYASEILQGLLGWIDQLALSLLRENKPIWISRNSFSEQLRRLLFRYQDLQFINETAEALIPTTEEDREKQRGKLFVRQLLWLGILEDDEQILDAIDAHIRAGTEVGRLSQKGLVSIPEFVAFEDRLVSRWKNLKRIHIPVKLPSEEENLQSLGQQLLNQTLNHRETLAGHQTIEFYLTQGGYHRLADEPPRLGWHPKFLDKLNEAKTESKG